MRNKLFISFLTTVLITILTILLFASINNRGLEKNALENELKTKLVDIENIIKNIEKDNLKDYLFNYDKNNNVRINIYNKNYINIYDSRNFVELVTKFDVSLIESINETKYAVGTNYKFSINRDLLYVVKEIDYYGEIAYLRISSPIVVTENRILLSSILLSTIIGIGISFLLTNIIYKKYFLPIKDVTNNIQEFNEGELRSDIDISNIGLIGDLQMSLKDLSNNITSIIDKNARRKSQLESILSSLNSGLIAIDNKGVILFHNIIFSKLFQLSSNLISRNIFENIYDKQLLELIRESQNKEYIERLRVEQSNGTIYDYKGLAIENDNVRIGTLILVNDVTQLALLEKVRKDFVSNVTHELKTPLTSIRGFSETLGNIDPLDTTSRDRFLSIIQEETDRLTYLIDDILVLSEVENNADIGKEQVDLNDVINSIIDINSINLSNKINIVFNQTPNITLITNEMRVRQVINNLLSNAIKYTEEGLIELSTSIDKGKVVFKIKDTGIGIPKKHQKRIFERFYRVDEHRSRKTGGTGLGLSIVKNIAEKYNWKLNIDSDVGVGTTITIKF